MQNKDYYRIADKAVALGISVIEAKKLLRQNQRNRKKRKKRPKYFKKGWRTTLQYHFWRKQVLERADWSCTNCKSNIGVMCGHHIDSSKDLRYDIDNGVCLCEKCHNAFHRGELIIYF